MSSPVRKTCHPNFNLNPTFSLPSASSLLLPALHAKSFGCLFPLPAGSTYLLEVRSIAASHLASLSSFYAALVPVNLLLLPHQTKSLFLSSVVFALLSPTLCYSRYPRAKLPSDHLQENYLYLTIASSKRYVRYSRFSAPIS